jgi:uncharacterized membrane protein
MPSPVLVASYLLHFAATVVWIGGLVLFAFFPASDPSGLPPAQAGARRRTAMQAFVPAQWLCLAVFVVSGLIQMSANPSYTGLLTVTNLWAAAILAKHVLVALMAAVLVYQTWVLYPRRERLAFGLHAGGPDAQERLRFTERRLVRLSAIAGIAVLVLTAVARASN